MNTAEQSRTLTLASQINVVEEKINAAIAKGKFECEGANHLEQSTLDAISKYGYRIRNGSCAFNDFWHASWKPQV